jgi:hypothetical protein
MTSLANQEVRTVTAIAREGNGMAARAVVHHREAMAQPSMSRGRRHRRRAAERAARRALAAS